MCPNLAYRLQHFESGGRCLAVPERRHRSAVTLSLVGQIELPDIEHDHRVMATSYLDSPRREPADHPVRMSCPQPSTVRCLGGLARVTGRVRAVALRRPGRHVYRVHGRHRDDPTEGAGNHPRRTGRRSPQLPPTVGASPHAEREREVHTHPVLARTPGRHPKRTTVRRRGRTAIGEGRIPWLDARWCGPC
jgi:hypothetical protein